MSESSSSTPTWTPEVEEARKYLLEKFADRFSMEAIASAAYVLAGPCRTSREEFEQWARNVTFDNYPLERMTRKPELYRNWKTQHAWEGWQAAKEITNGE